MNLDEMKQTWAEQTRKLDRALSLNLQVLKSVHLDKTVSALGRYKAGRVFELVVGAISAGFLGAYVFHRMTVPTLAIPALILDVFAIVGVAGTVRQLILLQRINFADPVATIQRKVEEVKLDMLRPVRLMVLSLPFYMAYLALGFDLLFGVDILAQGAPALLWANFALGAVFFAPAVWLFRNLSFRNAGHPLVRIFIEGAGGKQLVAAIDFLGRVEEFETENL
jgi:hypothetical protein